MDHTARIQRTHSFAAQVSHQSELTLFVDNIGPDCSKAQVLQWLDSNGFQDTYDYLYVPRCFNTRKSTGQMFINFFVVDVVDEFVEAIKTATFGSHRTLRVQLSTTQGLEANMSRWVRARAKRIRDAEVLPYVRTPDGSGVAHPAEARREAALAPKCSEVPVPSAWNPPPTSRGAAPGNARARSGIGARPVEHEPSPWDFPTAAAWQDPLPGTRLVGSSAGSSTSTAASSGLTAGAGGWEGGVRWSTCL